MDARRLVMQYMNDSSIIVLSNKPLTGAYDADPRTML